MGNPGVATQPEVATTQQIEPNTDETNQTETKSAKSGHITLLDMEHDWFLVMLVTPAAWLLSCPDWLIRTP